MCSRLCSLPERGGQLCSFHFLTLKRDSANSLSAESIPVRWWTQIRSDSSGRGLVVQCPREDCNHFGECPRGQRVRSLAIQVVGVLPRVSRCHIYSSLATLYPDIKSVGQSDTRTNLEVPPFKEERRGLLGHQNQTIKWDNLETLHNLINFTMQPGTSYSHL